MLATFSEPLKQDVQMGASAQRSNYQKHVDLPVTKPTSTWYNLEDFVELDWLSSKSPVLHLLPLATFLILPTSSRTHCCQVSFHKQANLGLSTLTYAFLGSSNVSCVVYHCCGCCLSS